MKKTAAAALALVGLLALGACSDDDGSGNGASAVCVDQSGNRVPDNECGSGGSAMGSFFEWYYISSLLNQPRYGQQVVHNHYYYDRSTNPYAGFRAPSSVPIYRGVPSSGYRSTYGRGFTSGRVTIPRSIYNGGSFNKPANRPYGGGGFGGYRPMPRPA